MPKDSDIDKAITLQSLLDKKDKNDWSTAKAAVVEGYVVQLEHEEDGDYHIVLAANAGETDTTKWVIVEVTGVGPQTGLSFEGQSRENARSKGASYGMALLRAG